MDTGYVENIKVISRFEQIKVGVILDATSWKSGLTNQ